jgi:5-methylcytosine-specific restriction endonuclease McrA
VGLFGGAFEKMAHDIADNPAPAMIVGGFLIGVAGLMVYWYFKYKPKAPEFDRSRLLSEDRLLEGPDNVVPFERATKEMRAKVMRLQGWRCANPYCRMDLRGGAPHLDHIVPRVKGGTDSIHNLQFLCDTCNTNKRDKDWAEFLREYAAEMGFDPTDAAPWQRWQAVRRQV